MVTMMLPWFTVVVHGNQGKRYIFKQDQHFFFTMVPKGNYVYYIFVIRNRNKIIMNIHYNVCMK